MKKNKVIVMTLRQVLGHTKLEGDVEIINECNETLVLFSNVDNNVCGLDKLLSDDMLDRKVLGVETAPGFISFRLEGVEDAE